MPYMQGTLHAGDVCDETIAVLEGLLENEATIHDENRGREPSLVREDVREAREEAFGEVPTAEQSVPETQKPLKGALPKMEMRLRCYIEEVIREVESQIKSHFEQHLTDLN